MPKHFLSIEIFGDKIVHRQLLRGAERAGNMKPALWDVREDIFRIIKINFESQGRRGGGSWKFLDPKTVEAKARRGLDPRILIARGRLMNSLTRRGDRDMRSAVTKHNIRLTSTKEYAEVHNFGSADGHIPARPFIEFLPNDKKRWIKMCEASLVGAMRGA